MLAKSVTLGSRGTNCACAGKTNRNHQEQVSKQVRHYLEPLIQHLDRIKILGCDKAASLLHALLTFCLDSYSTHAHICRRQCTDYEAPALTPARGIMKMLPVLSCLGQRQTGILDWVHVSHLRSRNQNKEGNTVRKEAAKLSRTRSFQQTLSNSPAQICGLTTKKCEVWGG